MKNIMEVANISKSYGIVKAIKNVSFTVREGDFFTFLGPSGCGKTTILRILGGFIQQDKGNVFINGKDMNGIPPNKRNTSMVFQNLALFPHMNVKENIIYGLRKKHTSLATINEKFKRIMYILGLEGFDKRAVSSLSGGQQQRVALARSLIIEPDILLLDEPLASLDKKLRIAMQDELKKIQQNTGTTFLYVTHDQSEALTMSDTIAVMNEGNIIQTGTPYQIYNRPYSVFTADFIGSGNFIPIKSVRRTGGLLDIETCIGRIIKLREIVYQEDYTYEQEIDMPLFFIRPEKIKTVKRIVENANNFKGIILSSVFEGPDIRLEIDSNELGRIIMKIKNDGTPLRFQKSESINFYWEYKDGIILYS